MITSSLLQQFPSYFPILPFVRRYCLFTPSWDVFGALISTEPESSNACGPFFPSYYQNEISSWCSELEDPEVRGHHTIHWATQSLDHNVNKSPFIFVTAASIQGKTVPKIISVGITYWFVSYSAQSLFYSCSGRGQDRLKITPSVWSAGLRNLKPGCSSQGGGSKISKTSNRIRNLQQLWARPCSQGTQAMAKSFAALTMRVFLFVFFFTMRENKSVILVHSSN